MEKDENEFSAKTPIGPIAVKGSLAIGIILMLASVYALGYMIHQHDSMAHQDMRGMIAQQRITNCLLTIPQEERTDASQLRLCMWREDGESIPRPAR